MGRSLRTAALFLLCLAFAVATAPSTTRAVDDEIPTCEEVLSCVVFDPAAAAPGTTVTITPIVYDDDDYPAIPIVSECPPEGQLQMLFLEAGQVSPPTSAFSPLVGDEQLARFPVPDVAPGEYDAVVYCGAIDLGMIVGVFRVLAVEAPQGTPTPTPEATPTPAATPTPVNVTTAPIDVFVGIDRDRDAGTPGDHEIFDGTWQFAGDFGAAEVTVAEPTYSGESDPAHWEIRTSAATPVVITAESRDGFTLAYTSCWETFDEFSEKLEHTVAGSTVSFRAAVTDVKVEYLCTFVFGPTLTPSPALSTLPPTDAATTSASSGSDAWPVLLAGLAALVAAVLVLGSDPTARRRR